MEAAELDVQLEELEVRLERLRALYEQYFLGIEKLEPTVARKDVDRRIYILRREKIRNTGKRFKLQTIIQRYNTFQQYWHRICREIENGTYKRHVARAERIFGPQELLTIAARKRFGRRYAAEQDETPAAASSPPPAPASAPAPPAASAPAPPAASTPAPPAASAPAPPAASAPAPRAASAAAPAVSRVPQRSASLPERERPQAQPATAAPRVSAKPQQFESLDLDMDFLGDWDPAAKPAAPKPAAPKPAAPKPAEPPKAATAPAPAAAPPSAPPPAAAPPSRMPTPIPVRAPRKPIPKPELKPEPKPQARPEPKAPSPASAAGVDDARIRDLHGRLNDLKRQNQEAGQVSLEGLTKSLRATEEKLRKQHAGRSIDFDVVVKDGKAVVKPIVR